MSKRKSQSPDIHALLQDGFSEETARELYAQGEEIAIFVMLQLAALAKKVSRSTACIRREPQYCDGEKNGTALL